MIDDENEGRRMNESSLPPPPDTYRPLDHRTLRERGTATAPFVLGIVGTVLGLIPFVGFVAIILGLIGAPLGIIAWRHHKRLARAATILSFTAIAMGVIGIAIVVNTVNDTNKNLDQIKTDFDVQMECIRSVQSTTSLSVARVSEELERCRTLKAGGK